MILIWSVLNLTIWLNQGTTLVLSLEHLLSCVLVNYSFLNQLVEELFSFIFGLGLVALLIETHLYVHKLVKIDNIFIIFIIIKSKVILINNIQRNRPVIQAIMDIF